ncbi:MULTISPECIES: hypothetical protein [Comamonadaceae]|uniref:DUF5983 domain-containing protein n=1 Tax=Alicycliphilus denitrificans (strain DSM 14773 / CIP 107495 / K601) TaxID=596154 RepID=F4G9U5_ALIDK|nr:MULTISPECIES: hypothetical protein [Comamonadaceae]AEB85677.1 hypothetical protein Alide2_3337 [Alicycliphilus denitrificans K601]
MNTACIERLRELAESITALSLSHLQPATRAKLHRNDLSVNAYPTEFGGLVYVGSPPHRIPVETDLALIAGLSARAGIEWLFFDSEGPVIDGLPMFASQDSLPDADQSGDH